MGEEVKELSKYRFEKAQNNIELASTLLSNNEYGFAQNRAYYAVFNAIRAVNALDGFDSSKHSGVISHFNQCYVKPGYFDADTSRIIRKASMLREKSDYEDFYEPSQIDAEEVIKATRRFLSEVEAYLLQRGIPL